MRFTPFVIFVFGLPAVASAQAQPCGAQPYAFDPYKPSHLAVVRQFGGSVLAHAPLVSLLQLDPYVPTQAQLLREYGGALPVWPFAWNPAYGSSALQGDCGPVRDTAVAATTTPGEPPMTTFAEALSALQQARASSPAPPPSGVRSITVTASADRKAGVWIEYAGRTWISAGRAVAFDDSEFVRVGESAGFPVFTRRGASDEIVYVPTTTGVVAPFRAEPR
jgi:hypothetical protein